MRRRDFLFSSAAAPVLAALGPLTQAQPAAPRPVGLWLARAVQPQGHFLHHGWDVALGPGVAVIEIWGREVVEAWGYRIAGEWGLRARLSPTNRWWCERILPPEPGTRVTHERKLRIIDARGVLTGESVEAFMMVLAP